MSDTRKTNDSASADASVDAATTDALVRACIDGDHDAMGRLYERCSGRVYALMVRLVGRQDADDAMQLAFMQIFRKLDRFSGGSKLETWIYRVATNEALQLLRRRKRENIKTLNWEPESKVCQSGLRLEDAEILDAGLAKLDHELRAVLTLKEVQELSYAEIAEILDIPEGTVGSRLNRARRELR
ncbi:MAG: RNA polymerase sigma factor, partial [Aureliella sp.]